MAMNNSLHSEVFKLRKQNVLDHHPQHVGLAPLAMPETSGEPTPRHELHELYKLCLVTPISYAQCQDVY